MSNDIVTVRNTKTGQVDKYERRIFDGIMNHKVFEIVEDGTKPYAKKTYKPRKPKDENPETESVSDTGNNEDKE